MHLNYAFAIDETKPRTQFCSNGHMSRDIENKQKKKTQKKAHSKAIPNGR